MRLGRPFAEIYLESYSGTSVNVTYDLNTVTLSFNLYNNLAKDSLDLYVENQDPNAVELVELYPTLQHSENSLLLNTAAHAVISSGDTLPLSSYYSSAANIYLEPDELMIIARVSTEPELIYDPIEYLSVESEGATKTLNLFVNTFSLNSEAGNPFSIFSEPTAIIVVDGSTPRQIWSF